MLRRRALKREDMTNTMFKLNLADAGQFLQQYWQKQPLLIRGGFSDFQDLLDEDDLAGLAQEHEIDARIVTREKQQWQVYQGPFADEDFEQYCRGQWSLLVQGVEGYLDAGTELINAFDFIPAWRIDDLMVSFSVPGGGVGHHVDQYDVFIIQGKGRRRWQVGGAGDTQEMRPHPLLSQVAPFEPIIDAVLECGDVLYIPPGFAHCGESLEDCLNYSVGLRAPDQQALLSSFADFVIDSGGFQQRYQDPGLTRRTYSREVSRGEIQALRTLMQQTFEDKGFEHWLGSFLSAGEQYGQGAVSFSTGEVAEYLQSGQPVIRSLDCKGVWLEQASRQPVNILYLGELHIPFEQCLTPYLEPLLQQPYWYYSGDADAETFKLLAELVRKLLNTGLWSLSED
ncbi:cupin domain-containing protein [Lacimicrobium alkaliphilum]|uniref:50S ribosomal protein L16 arginine hydroxylase n=1 Tax=Lacimicrobium alkaliphilum TaxID=1526571 RepID=A0ABQ1RR94_9ALTE|nr:cupin domain-containing protein [Lacimicrobium alkaliphilum]GGD75505.1 50S ribosomal protein L16 arginine hydroxylase [Lacimicrobium alkaliphilum]